MKPLTYAIRAVAKLTGISVDTLRAWERRYGVVVPERDERGRVYSEADVERLTLLRRAVERGHPIGRVAPLGVDELRALVGRPAPSPGPTPGADRVAVAGLLAAVDRFDFEALRRELTRLAVVLTPRQLALDVALPLMRAVGEAWHDGKLTIGQEHLVTAEVRSLVGSLARLREPPPGAPRLLIATTEGEPHELGALVASFNTMVAEVARSHVELKRTEALRQEVQIAHRIQTAILPNSPAVPGYEVAARMKPAEDVGGDLYDILSFPETYWVLVGDVSGHGINSGLVMMMAQAAAYGTIADDPNRDPRDVVSAVNRVVHENVRQRMGRDDYLTFMAARHMGDGRFVAAGAHQPVFIARVGGAVDVIEPAGPWIGLTADLSTQIVAYEFHLGPGDAVCFITDGVVEAADSEGTLFGEDRLTELLRAERPASAAEILTEVFQEVEAHSALQADDITVVVLRRKTDDD